MNLEARAHRRQITQRDIAKVDEILQISTEEIVRRIDHAQELGISPGEVQLLRIELYYGRLKIPSETLLQALTC